MSQSDFRKIIRKLASPNVMFFSLMWLMVITIVGTIAQKYIGLYQAQNLFFSSWFFWYKVIPIPGGLCVMTVIFWCLIVKLIFASEWSISNSGVIITHIGGLLLLVGGFLTSVNSSEGAMFIYEGDSSNFITDYHIREFTVYEVTNGNNKIFAINLNKFKAHDQIVIPETPLRVNVLTASRNCDVSERNANDLTPGEELRARATQYKVKPAPLEIEDERNRSCIEFRLSGADAMFNGVYFSVDDVDEAPVVSVGDKTYRLVMERRHTYLPFQITLKKFDKQFHPGTEIASKYASSIILKDGNAEWPSIIQMNEPLRYKGYTFYQSSFSEEENRKASILAVVKNAGRMFPYISGIVICIGLIIHMILRLPKLIEGIMRRRNLKSLLLALVLGSLCFMSPSLRAASLYEFDYTDFKKIPVLDQGRVKPMNTLAQNYLKLFHSSSSLSDMNATEWLAEVLFEPEKAYDKKIFNISDPRVMDALGLEHRKPHYYTYHEVGAGIAEHINSFNGIFEKPEEKLDAFEKELANTYHAVQTFSMLSRSLSLLFPEFQIPSGVIADTLHVKPGTYLSYLEMLDYQDQLATLSSVITAKSQKNLSLAQLGQDLETLSSIDALQKHMDKIAEDRQNNTIFQIIPPQWDNDKRGKLWYSPWGITFLGQGSPDTIAFIHGLKDLIVAYRLGDISKFGETSRSLNAQSLAMAQEAVTEPRILLEVAYGDYEPFRYSMALYGLAFVLVMFSLMLKGEGVYYASAVSLLFAFALHGIGLLSRMIIMGRPPVTNLYASIVFVGFMIALTSIAYEWRMRNRVGLIVASVAGLLLQYLGLKYDVDGDTMGMLVAVLDTNFWLSTHVVCMTTGYACCMLGSLMAHVYLLMRMIKPQEKERFDELGRNIRGISYLALMFSTVGTILGGIWADQSWGRFWGWDPKENGALLICLWLLFITHGRMAGRLKDIGFNIGMAFTSVPVSLAWFGVNLLGVGLHSYGFTQGALSGLFSFIVGEILFAITSYVVITSWQKRNPAQRT